MILHRYVVLHHLHCELEAIKSVVPMPGVYSWSVNGVDECWC